MDALTISPATDATDALGNAPGTLLRAGLPRPAPGTDERRGRTSASASAHSAKQLLAAEKLANAALVPSGAAGPRPASAVTASAGREVGRSARYATTPGPAAYTPELPGPGRFSIGARRKTSTEEEAAAAASRPGPGAYKVGARWDHAGGVNLGATSGRERSLDGSGSGDKPGPGAYAPELPGSTSFSIGTRRKTSIDEEASNNASKPGPGQYKTDARWAHIGGVNLGATGGRDKAVSSVDGDTVAALRPAPVPGPGAYAVPSMLSESSFRIGKREQTSIAAEAAANASKPGPGQYKVSVKNYVGAVKLGATSGRERSLDGSGSGNKPGPGAYTPELPGSTSFSIGTRRKTIIDEEASNNASKPAPGQYKTDARWAHVGGVNLGATGGRDRAVSSINGDTASALKPPAIPGPGAYTLPSTLSSSNSFRIGTRERTIIAELADAAASKPAPGQYRTPAQWGHVGSVSLGGASGRDRPIPATPNNPNALSNLAPP